MSPRSDEEIRISFEHLHDGPRTSTAPLQTQALTRYASSEGNLSPASMALTSAMSEPSYSSHGWLTSPGDTYPSYSANEAYPFEHLSPFGSSPISPRPRASSTSEFSDEPGRAADRDYCCLYPHCASKPFARNADLDRHYKQKHTDSSKKASWFCDYNKCNRRREPFHRLDHFRDHLRQYHKEGIEKRGVFGSGAAEGGGKAKQESRRSSTGGQDWWRCPRCLKRNDEDLSECQSCRPEGLARRK